MSTEAVHVCVRLRGLTTLEREQKQTVVWQKIDNSIVQKQPRTMGSPLKSLSSNALVPASPRGSIASAASIGSALSSNSGNMNASSSVSLGGGAGSGSQQLSSYTFDAVFGPSDGNDVLYEQNAKSLVASALDGFHATVFAYGITSSGKTYTMLGTPDNWGVIPRAVHDVLAHVAAHPERDWQLAVSYLELYNEKINDLLGDRANLDLREDPERGVFVADLTEVPVDTTQGIRGVLQLLALGESRRHFGATNLNERSSRSHTIFRMSITSSHRVTSEGILHGSTLETATGAVRSSLLNLVDLAGSERVTQSGAEGERFVETCHINRSLLTLGNVVERLSERSRKPGASAMHVPYRDSRLTRILQPALGGNSRTLVVCTVSPAYMHVAETQNTLLFASRAKQIHNRVTLNETVDQKQILKKYRAAIMQLKEQLVMLKTASGTAQVDTQATERAAELEGRVVQAEARMHQLEDKHQLEIARLHATSEHQNTRYAAERQQLQEQVSTLQTKLSAQQGALHGQATQFQTRVDALESELVRVRGMHDEATRESAVLRTQLTQRDARIDDLLRAQRDLEARVARARDDAATAATEREQAHEQRARQTQQRLDTVARELHAQIEAERERSRELEAHLARERAEAARKFDELRAQQSLASERTESMLQSELQRVTGAHQSALERARQQLVAEQARATELEAQLTAAQRAAAEAHEAFTTRLAATQADLQARNAQLAAQLQSERERLERAASDGMHTVRATLEQQVTDAHAQLRDAEARHETRVGELQAAHKRELQLVREQLAAIQQRVAAEQTAAEQRHRNEAAELREQLDAERKAADDLRAELDAARTHSTDELGTLQAQLDQEFQARRMYKETIMQLEQDIAQLNDMLAAERDLRLGLERTRSSLDTKLHETATRMSADEEAARAGLQRLLAVTEAASQEVAALKERLARCTSERDEVQAALDETRTRLHDEQVMREQAEATIEREHSAREQSDSSVAELRTSLAASDARAARAEDDAASAREAGAAMRTEFEEVRQRLEEHTEQLRVRVADLEASLVGEQARVADASAERDAARAASEALTEQLFELRTTLQQTRAELAQRDTERVGAEQRTASQLAELHEALAVAQQAGDALRGELAAARSRLTHVESLHAAQGEDADAVRTTLRERESALSDAHDKLCALRRDLAACQTTLEAQRDEIDQLQAAARTQNSSTRAANATLRAELDTANARLAELREQVAELTGRLSGAQSERQELANKLRAVRTDNDAELERALAEAARAKHALAEQEGVFVRRVEAAEERVRELDERVAALTADNRDLSTQLQTQIRSAARAKDANETAEQQLASQRARAADLEQQLSDAQRSLKTAQSTTTTFRQQAADSARRLKEVQDELATVLETLNRVQRENTQLKRELTDESGTRTRLFEDVLDKDARLHIFRAERAGMLSSFLDTIDRVEKGLSSIQVTAHSISTPPK